MDLVANLEHLILGAVLWATLGERLLLPTIERLVVRRYARSQAAR